MLYEYNSYINMVKTLFIKEIFMLVCNILLKLGGATYILLIDFTIRLI